jgi:multidrug efflux pump subunit AcrB
MALSGSEAATFKQDGQEYSIRVEYPEGRFETVTDLDDLMLVSPMGASVPLTDISTVEFTDSPQTIPCINSEYFVEVIGTPTTDGFFEAQEEVMAEVNALRFPNGVDFYEDEQMQMMNDELIALGQASVVANFLVFMVMAIQFESIKHSLMVMLCIPFSVIGSFFFMFLMNATISMVSMLGFLILVGTVVNNGILFVDTANQYRRSMDVETALIQTGRHRLRPILMTTLTTILSMIPMLFATGSAAMMSGLAIAVIGGLTASTILTLLLLPTFYLIIDGNEQKKKRKAEKKRLKREERDRQMQEEMETEIIAE